MIQSMVLFLLPFLILDPHVWLMHDSPDPLADPDLATTPSPPALWMVLTPLCWMVLRGDGCVLCTPPEQLLYCLSGKFLILRSNNAHSPINIYIQHTHTTRVLTPRAYSHTCPSTPTHTPTCLGAWDIMQTPHRLNLWGVRSTWNEMGIHRASVADPWHFGVDPDPYQRIHASD
jgi:hypothetical protein